MTEPTRQALRDIRDDIYTNHKPDEIFTHWSRESIDTWFCFGEHLYNKEQRRLNKKVGIWSINKIGNPKMSRIQ